MEPRIQYAKTSDGVNIAYWTMGQGRPLVVAKGPFSHVQKEMGVPEQKAFFERLARTYTVINYDMRGTGLSDRQAADISPAACARDIEAVVRQTGHSPVTVFSTGAAPIAVEFARAQPAGISGAVFWQPIPFGADPVFRTLSALIDVDWELYTDALVLWVQGWSAGEASSRISKLFRDATTPAALKAFHAEMATYDFAAALRDYTTPTLLLFRAAARLFSEDGVRAIASMIPHAQTAFIEGDIFAWYLPDPEPVAQAIESFVSGERRVSPSETSTGIFRTIMFTDIEESTSLTQRLGDAAAQEMLRKHNAVIRKAVADRQGTEIKHTGDGIMASFPAASGAVNAAIEIQRAFAEQTSPSTGAGRSEGVKVRIGINAGEPVAEKHPDGQGDLFGTSVIMASRIAALANGGEILVSDVVRQLVAGKRYMFSDRGEQALRGFDDPVRVFEVRWQDQD